MDFQSFYVEAWPRLVGHPAQPDKAQPVTAAALPSRTTQPSDLADGPGGQPQEADALSGPVVAIQGGLGFTAPGGWTVTGRPGCPGRASEPEIVAPEEPFVAAVPPGCPLPQRPFALLEVRRDRDLPGAGERTVAGHRVLVRPGPAGEGRFPVPPGWTVTTAVLPVHAGAVWLQVAEPGPGAPLFEQILGSVSG